MTELRAREEAPPEVPGGEPPERVSFAAAFLEALVEGNTITVMVLAVVAGIIVGGLLIAFSDPHVLGKWGHFFEAPGGATSAAWRAASSAYTAMFRGAILNTHSVSAAFHGGSITAVFEPLSETVVRATPLILAGLAVMIPFRCGLFNIGAAGQFVGGAFIAGWIGFGVQLPPVIHVTAALVGGLAGGAACGWLIGWLRARTGANEVITTIMFNYISYYFLLYVLGTSRFRRKGHIDPISPVVHGTARLPHILGGSLRINAGIIVALIAAAGTAWLLKRSTIGFEFRSVGANPDAARNAGMNVERSYVLVMLIAGAMAGLAGASVLLGTEYALTPTIYGTYGFDAITIALLGKGQPFGVVLAALLYGALQAGGVQMQAATQIPVDIVTVISAVIVLFVAAPPLVRTIFRLRGQHTGAEAATIKAVGG